MATHIGVVISLESKHLRMVLPVLWFSGRELRVLQEDEKAAVRRSQQCLPRTPPPQELKISHSWAIGTGHNLPLRAEGVFPVLP